MHGQRLQELCTLEEEEVVLLLSRLQQELWLKRLAPQALQTIPSGRAQLHPVHEPAIKEAFKAGARLHQRGAAGGIGRC